MGENILIKENTNTIILKSEYNFDNLDEFIEKYNISKRLYKKLYRDKKIYVNNNFQRKDIEINKNDNIILLMDDENIDIKATKIDLDIVYEDMDMIVIDKKPFLPVHNNRFYQDNTLSNGIAYYFREKGIKKKIRIVNRLDMDTSGLLIIAKSQYIDQQLSLQFKEQRVIKKYLALVEGIILEENGIIDKNILKIDSSKKIIDGSGKDAFTKYKVVERYKDMTLLEIEIKTGRSHQIRIHLAEIGHPIVGDELYGVKNKEINRQALHSYYLKIFHPRLMKEYIFKSELPKDIKYIIEKNYK